MHDWYYLDSARNRHGPVPGDDLVRLLQAGALHAQTPVWREGLGDWQPLSAVLPSLGVAVPPPLPSAHPYVAPVPRGRGPGCWIALAVVALFGLVVLAFLAAIAIPAYQDYTKRSRVVEAAVSAAPLRAEIAGHLADTGACPDKGTPALVDAAAVASASPRVAGVQIHRGANCGFGLVLRDMGDARLDGATLDYAFDADTGGWQCSASFDARYLPSDCRH